MSPIQQPLVAGQPLDYDPSTLEIPSGRRIDQHTLAIANRYAGRHEPDIDALVNAIVDQESGGRPDARGKKGEVGLAQIMPSTAAQYGVTPEALAHPEVNKMVAKRYLGDLLHKYKGNVDQAVAAYNAGPGNVDRGNIPQSTRDYVSRVRAKAGSGAAPPFSFPSHPDESTLEIPSVYRPGGPPQQSFAQNMLFTPQDMGLPRTASPLPPSLAGGGPGGGGQAMVSPPPDMQRARPAPPVLGTIGRGAPPRSLQDILSTAGPEDKYGPLGQQPFSALQAGDYFRPQETRQMAALATGGAGAEEEIPELSGAARGIVRRARQFGVDPEDIGPLAQRVREGTLTERGLSQALKNLRAQLPDTAKVAAAVRGVGEDLPVDLRAAISKGVREGKITLQQAKRMLKAAGIGGAAIGAILGGGAGKGTAQAGEQPKTLSDQFQQLPQFQSKSPEQRQRILADFNRKSPEVQQQIIQRLSKPAARPWYPPWASMEQGVFEPNPAYVKATEPWANLYARGAQGIEENLKFKPFRDMLAGSNESIRFRPPPGEWEKWGGRTFGPGQNVLQGAINTYLTLAGPVQALYQRGGIEAVPTGLRWMVPLIKTGLRRIGTPAGIGYGVNKALGGSGASGAAFGGFTGLTGEALSAIWNRIAGPMGETAAAEKVGKDVAGQIGKALPGVDVTEPELVRLGTKGEIVDKVRAATQQVRDRAYQAAQTAKATFRVPVISDTGRIVGHADVGLREAEQTLDKMGRYSFTPKAEPKLLARADAMRGELNATRERIVQGLNAIGRKYPKWINVGDAWSRQRLQNAAAQSVARLLQVGNGVIDLATGRINQPNLLTSILKNKGDLIRTFGKDGFDALYDAASRHGWRGVMDVASEAPSAGMRLPHGVHLSLGSGGKIAGQTPIWMYPPSSSFALGAQPVVGAVGGQAAQ